MATNLSAFLKSSAGQTLGSMASFLRKAAAHAEATSTPEENYLGARLFPDMLPMSRQVQIACDITARGGSRLAGSDAPSFPDTETSFEALAVRCEKALEVVMGLSDEGIGANGDVTLKIPTRGEPMHMTGQEFLIGFIVPNLHFHAATAYALLRHQGVALGKTDFLKPGG